MDERTRHDAVTGNDESHGAGTRRDNQRGKILQRGKYGERASRSPHKERMCRPHRGAGGGLTGRHGAASPSGTHMMMHTINVGGSFGGTPYYFLEANYPRKMCLCSVLMRKQAAAARGKREKEGRTFFPFTLRE